MSGVMVRVTAMTTVARPVDDVFAFISRIENHPTWHRRALQTWRAADGPMIRGQEWLANVQTIAIGSTRLMRLRVTEYELNKQFVSWTDSGRFPFGSGYELEGVGPVTHVLCVREMKLAGWRSILQPAVRSILRREIDQEARDLKRVLEAISPTIASDGAALGTTGESPVT